MALDVELYRRTVHLPTTRRNRQAPRCISVIDIAPEGATHTMILMHGYGGNALQWSCQVTVIDLATRKTIATQRIEGSPPPRTTVGRRGASHSGDKPRNEVFAYLQGLPRK